MIHRQILHVQRISHVLMVVAARLIATIGQIVLNQQCSNVIVANVLSLLPNALVLRTAAPHHSLTFVITLLHVYKTHLNALMRQLQRLSLIKCVLQITRLQLTVAPWEIVRKMLLCVKHLRIRALIGSTQTI